jgi:Flp pilus assembly protein TadG
MDMFALKQENERTRSGRIARNQRGQALAETGIAISLLLLLVMGVIEFGRAFMVANMITHAERDGARSAAVVPVTERDDSGAISSTAKSSIVSQVRTSIEAVVGSSAASALTITVSQSGSAAAPPPLVTVTVTGDIPMIINWAGYSSFQVNRAVAFRDEGVVS